MRTTLYSELRLVEAGANINYPATPNQQAKISHVAREIMDEESRRIIDSYRLNGTVERIVDGEESFLNLGRPIIERCHELEAELERRGRMKLVRRRDILGKDARADISESVDYLARQGIVDPNIFFHTSLYGVPEQYNIGTKIKQIVEKHPRSTLGMIVGLPVTSGLIGRISTNSPEDIMIGIGLSFIPIVALLQLVNIFIRTPLPTQRQNFENALTYLDNEVKRLYHTPDFSI